MRCAMVFQVVLLLPLVPWVGETLAEDVHVSNDAELRQALSNAKPGNRLLLAPGKYRGGLSFTGLSGEKGKPIVISAADPKQPPILEGGGSGLHLRSPAFVELRDLIFQSATGNGLNIDDGGAPDAPGHDLILKNLVVREVGPKGNCDGIKLSGVDHFQIENCRVEEWGSSGSAIDMVGCHQGVIERCTFSEGTSDQANAVQTKGGSSEVVISHCRFVNCGGRGVNAGGSTGLDYFRPKDAAYEAQNITVEDCTFLGGMSAIAFVGVDGVIARHNTIYCPTKWPFRILQENVDSRFARCGNGKVEHNLILFRGEDVRTVVNVGGNTSPETFSFAGNVWRCMDRPADTKRLVSLPSKEKDGFYDFAPKFKDEEKGDLTLLEAAPGKAGVRSY